MDDRNQNLKQNIKRSLNSLKEDLNQLDSMASDDMVDNPEELIEFGEIYERAKGIEIDVCGLYCLYMYGLKGPSPDERRKVVKKASGDLYSDSIEQNILKTCEVSWHIHNRARGGRADKGKKGDVRKSQTISFRSE